MDRRIITISILVLAAGLAVIGYRQLSAGPVYNGTLIEPTRVVADFELQSDAGPLHLSEYRGKWVLVYFGYTFCPDVCPTTLSTLKKAFKEAGDIAADFQVIFISVDPSRDTPARMGEYTRFFNPDFIGATGPVDVIDTVTAQFAIKYHINDAEPTGFYTVDHTSVVTAIDPEGNMRLIWNHEMTERDIAADMKRLVRQSK